MKVIFVVLACLFSTGAFAQEREREFSVGANIGNVQAAPWANPKLKDATGFLGYRAGAWIRFHMPFPEGSWELGADHLEFAGSELKATTAILSIFWRFRAEAQLHPVFAFGGGIADTQHNFTAGNKMLSVYRIRAGIEYELQPRIDLAAYLDHFTIFRNSSSDPDIHALTPTIGIIYYFSDLQPIREGGLKPGSI